MSPKQKTLGVKKGRKPRGKAAVAVEVGVEVEPAPKDTEEDTLQGTGENNDPGEDLAARITEVGGAKKKRGKVTREAKIQITDPVVEEAIIEWVKETRLLWDKTCQEYRTAKYDQKLVVWNKKAPELAPDLVCTGKLFHLI